MEIRVTRRFIVYLIPGDQYGGPDCFISMLACTVLLKQFKLKSNQIKLALSTIRFTAQFAFTVSDRYSHEKMHTVSLVWRDGLISALVTTYTTFFIFEIQTGAMQNLLVSNFLNDFILCLFFFCHEYNGSYVNRISGN